MRSKNKQILVVGDRVRVLGDASHGAQLAVITEVTSDGRFAYVVFDHDGSDDGRGEAWML